MSLGSPGGQETLFLSLFDGTVRSFSMERNALRELSQIHMKCPINLLWVPRSSELFVCDFDVKKKAHNVRVTAVTGNTLEVHETALSADSNLRIFSWCLFDEEKIYCFNYNKREIVELKIK